MDLRPLIVVTGTLRVEGGEKNRVRNEDVSRTGTSMKVVVDRNISKDRRAANVIVTDYMRRLRGLFILRTPYGVLLDPKRLDAFKALLIATEKKIAAYRANGERKTRISNCVLYEKLRDVRLAAVTRWIADENAAGNEEVQAALSALVVGSVLHAV